MDTKKIDFSFKSLTDSTEKYLIIDEGTIQNYLGVEINPGPNEGEFELKQSFLIRDSIDHFGLQNQTKGKTTPTPAGRPLLHKDLKGLPRKHDWNYRASMGILRYLQGSNRPAIAMAVHQCENFNNDPMILHERQIKRIVKYLMETEDFGIVYKPDAIKGIEFFVDADVSGGWNQLDADNSENVMPRTGYVITHTGCPVLWCSKLET